MTDDTGKQVGQEHEEHARQVRALTEALHAHPVDLSEVRRVVAEIDRDIPGHFLREESAIFPWLVAVLPEAAAAVENLSREHDALFSSIATLRDSLQAAQAAVGPLCTSALEFLALFRDHLHREEALIEWAIARGQRPPISTEHAH